jgi:hypothetical protein
MKLSSWQEYHFKAKPGALNKRPPIIAPYHLRLDWLMWFLPFSVMVTPEGIHVYQYEDWFIRFVQKILEGDVQTLKLLKSYPFKDRPPKYLRASFYLYQFTNAEEFSKTGNYWKRTFIDYYLPPISLPRSQS